MTELPAPWSALHAPGLQPTPRAGGPMGSHLLLLAPWHAPPANLISRAITQMQGREPSSSLSFVIPPPPPRVLGGPSQSRGQSQGGGPVLVFLCSTGALRQSLPMPDARTVADLSTCAAYDETPKDKLETLEFPKIHFLELATLKQLRLEKQPEPSVKNRVPTSNIAGRIAVAFPARGKARSHRFRAQRTRGGPRGGRRSIRDGGGKGGLRPQPNPWAAPACEPAPPAREASSVCLGGA